MKNVTDYTNLEVWSKCRKLANAIYTLTRSFPETEQFGLTNQMRRCSVSVPSNIAEGCGRYHDKETLHFVYIARGTLYELETQVFISQDQNYVNQEQSRFIQSEIISCKKLLNGFIKFLKNNIHRP
jgi:four helix bundle protein